MFFFVEHLVTIIDQNVSAIVRARVLFDLNSSGIDFVLYIGVWGLLA